MQTTKFSSANFQKMLKVQATSEFKGRRTNSVNLSEVAHDDPPHRNLRCLHVQLISSLVLKELTLRKSW